MAFVKSFTLGIKNDNHAVIKTGITTGITNTEDIKKKVTDIASELGVEMQVFIASADDKYRKPGVGMWYCMARNNGGMSI